MTLSDLLHTALLIALGAVFLALRSHLALQTRLLQAHLNPERPSQPDHPPGPRLPEPGEFQRVLQDYLDHRRVEHHCRNKPEPIKTYVRVDALTRPARLKATRRPAPLPARPGIAWTTPSPNHPDVCEAPGTQTDSPPVVNIFIDIYK